MITDVYAGRARAILIATILTMLLPLSYMLVRGPLNGAVIELAVFIAVVCVGLPASWGITLLMIPLDRVARTRLGPVPTALLVVAANMLLVGMLCRLFSTPASDDAMVFYVSFAAVAAMIWLVADAVLSDTTQSRVELR